MQTKIAIKSDSMTLFDSIFNAIVKFSRCDKDHTENISKHLEQI